MKPIVQKRKSGKKLSIVKSKVNKGTLYLAQDAIDFLKSEKLAKFDETLEVALNTGLDPKHSDQMVRGTVVLPAGTGKDVKVAVFCKESKIESVKHAGADIIGSQELIDSIKSGVINFDVCIASPDMMGLIGSVAKILGPKGLMPNPKLGTVTNDLETAVKNAKNGQIEFRVEKAGIIQAGLGKLSFTTEALMQNLKAFVSTVHKSKPSGSKGVYLKRAHLSSTMGPSLKIDLNELLVNL
ncbi:MAG: 50S ribosomal protein L1 [Rickettsiaceae bacterium]|nr:50S ribosomal protein L1 [Rickettsiaceae bacterium]